MLFLHTEPLPQSVTSLFRVQLVFTRPDRRNHAAVNEQISPGNKSGMLAEKKSTCFRNLIRCAVRSAAEASIIC
jgi:hypothetical protein